jgi:hypothetical protein
VSSSLFLLAVLVQAGLAGLFVTGDVDMLGIHEINAGLVAATLVVWITSAVLLWRPVPEPTWPIAAGAAALAVVFGQLALGYSCGGFAHSARRGDLRTCRPADDLGFLLPPRQGGAVTTRRRFLGIAGGVAVAALSTTGFVALSGRRVSGGVLPAPVLCPHRSPCRCPYRRWPARCGPMDLC